MAASARRADVSPRCVTPKRLGRLPAPSLWPLCCSLVLIPAEPSGGVSSSFIGRFSSTQRLKERELLTCSRDPTEGQGRPVQASLGGGLLPVTLLPRLLGTPAPVQAWPRPPGHVPLPEHSSVPGSIGSLQATGEDVQLGLSVWVTGLRVPPVGSGLGAGSQPSCSGKMWKASGDTAMTWPRVAVQVWVTAWDRQLPETSFHVSPPCQLARGERALEWDRVEARACREEQAGEYVGPRPLLSLSVL